MKALLNFFVPGIPAPGGSKRGFIRGGHVAIVDAGGQKTKNWRAVVSHMAAEAMQKAGLRPLSGPLGVEMCFEMPRPKGHYRTGRHAAILRDDAPSWHTCKPDTTKLVRSTEDAMTGIVYGDDATIAYQSNRKGYSHRAGCYITVYQLIATDEAPTAEQLDMACDAMLTAKESNRE